MSKTEHSAHTSAGQGLSFMSENAEPGQPLTMSSLEIAELAERDHRNVMRDIRNMLQALGGPLNFEHTRRNPQNGQEYPIFLLPKRECVILVSGYDVKMRARIIDRWMELEKAATAPTRHMPDFKNIHELAPFTLELIKATTELAEYKVMAEPKVVFYDRVADSTNLIGLRQVGRILGLKPDRLIKTMMGTYLFREGGKLLAYSRHVDAGLFLVRTLTRDDGKVLIRTFVTPRGLQHLAKEFGSGPVITHNPTNEIIARNPMSVEREILRLVSRPEGVSLQEIQALTGMKEQTARSRLSKLKRNKGFNINRNPEDDRFYLLKRLNLHA